MDGSAENRPAVNTRNEQPFSKMIHSEPSVSEFPEQETLESGPPQSDQVAALQSQTDKPARIAVQEEIIKAGIVSSKTAKNYFAIYDRLLASAVRAQQNGENDQSPVDTGPHRVVDAIISRFEKGEISQGTATLYRSAVLWVLAQAIRAEDPDYEDAWHELSEFKPGASPAKKVKPDPETPFVSPDELTLLLRTLESGQRSVVTSAETIAWILATLATGLRPQEWLDASWDDQERTRIRVRSAKKTEQMPPIERMNLARSICGREVASTYEANLIIIEKYGELPAWEPENPYRTIDVDPELLPAVRTHMTMFKAAARDQQSYASHFGRVRKALWRATREMPGQPNISLYTFRHQFSSNVKAMAGSTAAAILLGHEIQSDGRQRVTANYGRARFGHRGPHGQAPRVAQNPLDRITPEEIVPRANEGPPPSA